MRQRAGQGVDLEVIRHHSWRLVVTFRVFKCKLLMPGVWFLNSVLQMSTNFPEFNTNTHA